MHAGAVLHPWGAPEPAARQSSPWESQGALPAARGSALRLTGMVPQTRDDHTLASTPRVEAQSSRSTEEGREDAVSLFLHGDAWARTTQQALDPRNSPSAAGASHPAG